MSKASDPRGTDETGVNDRGHDRTVHDRLGGRPIAPKARAQPKTRARKTAPAPPRAPEPLVRLHYYLATTTSVASQIAALDAAGDEPVGPFTQLGLSFKAFTDKSNGLRDFKSSLGTPHAIVVFLGHSVLAGKPPNVRARAISPTGREGDALSNAALAKALSRASAQIVILATCASSTFHLKFASKNLVLITTDSGRDGVTLSTLWARAIHAFLAALVGRTFAGARRSGGPANVKEAIDAANEIFSNGDTFVLSSGSGAFRLT